MSLKVFITFAILIVSAHAGIDIDAVSGRALPLYENYTGEISVYSYRSGKSELVSTIEITARNPEVAMRVAVSNPEGSVDTSYARIVTVHSRPGKVRSFIIDTDGVCNVAPEIDPPAAMDFVGFTMGYGYSDVFTAARNNKACVYIEEEQELSHFSCNEKDSQASVDVYYHYWVAEDGTPKVYAFSDNKDETLESDGVKYAFESFQADTVDAELLSIPQSCKDQADTTTMLRFAVGESGKACDNDGDKSALAQKGEDSLRSDIKGCAIRCAGAKDCASDCVRKATNISEGCSKCFGENVACVLKKCAVVCALSEARCNKCQAEKCQADFVACAGDVIP